MINDIKKIMYEIRSINFDSTVSKIVFNEDEAYFVFELGGSLNIASRGDTLYYEFKEPGEE